jgi:threonylcarbamoyladenosine tRNA methylthiotransferase MtaB
MKVYLDMVGCRLNQSELENYARQFRIAGHTLTADIHTADLVVINSCTVTAAAASDSRQMIRHAAQAGVPRVVVTGCWASLNGRECADLHGVSQVIGNQEKDILVPIILDLPATHFEHTFIQREPIPGSRLRTRAFIKVQDGCDNHCTYCITTIARGAGRSRSIPDVLEDIRSALDGSTQEIVLTGVHLGSWGYDFEYPSHLTELIQAILADTDTPRLRLSSLEPWDIDPQFFELWKSARLCRHLHLPLQSGCAATLKRMGRKISLRSYASLLHEARTAIPGLSITTDIITGFPQESDGEFAESLAFVKAMGFSRGHVFTYSARPGTAAALLPGQVPIEIAKKRSILMRQCLAESSLLYMEEHIGQTLSVLWEKATPLDNGTWELFGLSDNYLRVRAESPSAIHNQITMVNVTGIYRDGLTGVFSST